MKTIVVTGDRYFTDVETVAFVLDQVLDAGDRLIHGGQRGADTLAGMIGEKLGATVDTFDADWGRFGPAAGPIRNRKMLDEKPDLVVGFHYHYDESKGTKDCIEEAARRDIPWVLVETPVGRCGCAGGEKC